jgi:hypothetical protein
VAEPEFAAGGIVQSSDEKEGSDSVPLFLDNSTVLPAKLAAKVKVTVASQAEVRLVVDSDNGASGESAD